MLARLTLFPFPSPCAKAQGTTKTMIRVFAIFCKLNFKKLTALAMFTEAMQAFSKEKLPAIAYTCPKCGAKHPTWSQVASYERNLICYENDLTVIHNIMIIRLLCSSCGGTHAILPEIIVPYSSYSLLFILTVLRDYYLSKMTVQDICDKYMIAASTLYAWKHLFETHKRLWLGVLKDATTDHLSFLSSLPSDTSSKNLNLFFQTHAQSFLQGVTKTAHLNSS